MVKTTAILLFLSVSASCAGDDSNISKRDVEMKDPALSPNDRPDDANAKGSSQVTKVGQDDTKYPLVEVQGTFSTDIAKLATLATFSTSTTETLASPTGQSLSVSVSGSASDIHHNWANPEDASFYPFGENLAWLHVPNSLFALVPRDESKNFVLKASDLGFQGLRGVGWSYSSGMIKQGVSGRVAGFSESEFLAIVGTSVYIGKSVPKENDPTNTTASITGIPLPTDLQKTPEQVIGATINGGDPVLITSTYVYAQIETTLANGGKSFAWQRSNLKLAATDGTKDFRLAAVHAKIADNVFEPTAIVAVSNAGKVYMWKAK